MSFELIEPDTEAEIEHDQEHEPSGVACIIATSHIALTVGDLIYSAKLLRRREAFEAIHVIEQAQEHLNNALAQLTGKVWEITPSAEAGTA